MPGESLGAREEGLQAGSPGGPREWRLAVLWDEGLEAGSPPGGGIAGWESREEGLQAGSLGLGILRSFGGRTDSGESGNPERIAGWDAGRMDWRLGVLECWGRGIGGWESLGIWKCSQAEGILIDGLD